MFTLLSFFPLLSSRPFPSAFTEKDIECLKCNMSFFLQNCSSSFQVAHLVEWYYYPPIAHRKFSTFLIHSPSPSFPNPLRLDSSPFSFQLCLIFLPQPFPSLILMLWWLEVAHMPVWGNGSCSAAMLAGITLNHGFHWRPHSFGHGAHLHAHQSSYFLTMVPTCLFSCVSH